MVREIPEDTELLLCALEGGEARSGASSKGPNLDTLVFPLKKGNTLLQKLPLSGIPTGFQATLGVGKRKLVTLHVEEKGGADVMFMGEEVDEKVPEQLALGETVRIGETKLMIKDVFELEDLLANGARVHGVECKGNTKEKQDEDDEAELAIRKEEEEVATMPTQMIADDDEEEDGQGSGSAEPMATLVLADTQVADTQVADTDSEDKKEEEEEVKTPVHMQSTRVATTIKHSLSPRDKPQDSSPNLLEGAEKPIATLRLDEDEEGEDDAESIDLMDLRKTTTIDFDKSAITENKRKELEEDGSVGDKEKEADAPSTASESGMLHNDEEEDALKQNDQAWQVEEAEEKKKGTVFRRGVSFEGGGDDNDGDDEEEGGNDGNFEDGIDKEEGIEREEIQREKDVERRLEEDENVEQSADDNEEEIDESAEDHVTRLSIAEVKERLHTFDNDLQVDEMEESALRGQLVQYLWVNNECQYTSKAPLRKDWVSKFGLNKSDLPQGRSSLEKHLQALMTQLHRNYNESRANVEGRQGPQNETEQITETRILSRRTKGLSKTKSEEAPSFEGKCRTAKKRTSHLEEIEDEGGKTLSKRKCRGTREKNEGILNERDDGEERENESRPIPRKRKQARNLESDSEAEEYANNCEVGRGSKRLRMKQDTLAHVQQDDDAESKSKGIVRKRRKSSNDEQNDGIEDKVSGSKIVQEPKRARLAVRKRASLNTDEEAKLRIQISGADMTDKSVRKQLTSWITSIQGQFAEEDPATELTHLVVGAAPPKTGKRIFKASRKLLECLAIPGKKSPRIVSYEWLEHSGKNRFPSIETEEYAPKGFHEKSGKEVDLSMTLRARDLQDKPLLFGRRFFLTGAASKKYGKEMKCMFENLGLTIVKELDDADIALIDDKEAPQKSRDLAPLRKKNSKADTRVHRFSWIREGLLSYRFPDEKSLL